MDIPTTLIAFIIWLGSPAAISFALSNFIERQQWFQVWDADRKTRFALLLAILLAVVSFALNKWTPADIIRGIDPLFTVMINAAVTFWAMGRYHDATHSTTKVTSEARAATAAINAVKAEPPLSGAPAPAA